LGLSHCAKNKEKSEEANKPVLIFSLLRQTLIDTSQFPQQCQTLSDIIKVRKEYYYSIKNMERVSSEEWG